MKPVQDLVSWFRESKGEELALIDNLSVFVDPQIGYCVVIIGTRPGGRKTPARKAAWSPALRSTGLECASDMHSGAGGAKQSKAVSLQADLLRGWKVK